MKQRYCITFAGVVGSSKTPIAYYLSWNLGLPIFNNDAMRSEVTEDLLSFDQEEYIKRRDDRGKKLVASGRSFIYDASIDREWHRLHEWLISNDYRWFIISLDLSPALLDKLYQAKGYTESHRQLPKLIEQHNSFLNENANQIGLRIDDNSFPDRLKISLAATQNWVGLAEG